MSSTPANPGSGKLRMFQPDQFEVEAEGTVLRGESQGEGRDIFLAHGLSAARTYVVHGSKVLPRAGFCLHTWDARGHGESEPAPVYDYDHLAGPITTDAKVIPAVMAMHAATSSDLGEAFRRTVAEFDGSVAIAAASADAPEQVFLALRGSGQALYVGLGDDMFIVASEPTSWLK